MSEYQGIQSGIRDESKSGVIARLFCGGVILVDLTERGFPWGTGGGFLLETVREMRATILIIECF